MPKTRSKTVRVGKVILSKDKTEPCKFIIEERERVFSLEIESEILESLQTEIGQDIEFMYQDTKEGSQYSPVLGRKYKVDGFIHSTRTILEILGDVYHGHPGLGVGSIRDKWWHDVFKTSEDRLRLFANYGYKDIRYIWASEYIRGKPIWDQFIVFDGTLKTRSTCSSIYKGGDVHHRAGVGDILNWGRQPDYPSPTIGLPIRSTPQKCDDGLYTWIFNQEDIRDDAVSSAINGILDNVFFKIDIKECIASAPEIASLNAKKTIRVRI